MPGDPWWCSYCASLILVQLAELDDLAPLRVHTSDGLPASTAADPGRATLGDPGSPYEAGDDTEDTYRMLAAWETAYRELHGWPSPPRRGILATRRTTCIAWLGEHLPGILASPLAEDFGAEVMTWHRALKAPTKAGQRTLRKPLRCPDCRLLTLVWEEGGRYVQCGACGRILTYDEYEADVERLAASIGRDGVPAGAQLRDLRDASTVAAI